MLPSLFTISDKDQSIAYLGQIFGSVGNALVPAESQKLVGVMFHTINTVALTIGAALVIYVTVVGLFKTAQEGEFLGKQWSSLWVPVRTVLGIASLFPTGSGYSVIQVVFMWVILQGVGAADMLWTTVLNYIQVAGSVYATQSVAADPGQIKKNMQNLFKGLVCQAAASADYSPISYTPLDSGNRDRSFTYYPSWRASTVINDTKAQALIDNRTVTYNMGPAGRCGTLVYCDPTEYCKENSQSLKCLSCTAQRDKLQGLVDIFSATAEKFVALDYSYIYFYETGKGRLDWLEQYCMEKTGQACLSPNSTGGAASQLYDYRDTKTEQTDLGYAPENTVKVLYYGYGMKDLLANLDFITDATRDYTTMLENNVINATNKQDLPEDGDDAWMKESKDLGWILAGAFYYRLTEKNQSYLDDAYPTFIVSPPSNPVSPLGGSEPPNSKKLSVPYRHNYQAAGYLLSALPSGGGNVNDQLANTDTNTNTGVIKASDKKDTLAKPSEMKEIDKTLGETAGTLLDTFIKNLKGTSDVAGATTLASLKVNPLTSISGFGYAMMILAQVLFWAAIGIALPIIAVSGLDTIMFWGTGIPGGTVGAAVKFLFMALSPFLILLVGSLYTLGATLGIYVPLIPYIIFTMGAIGWMLATIEAMVAAPLVALGILSPGGQHEILGRAENTLMLLFNLFLRPMLMVFGLVVSLFLSIAVVNLINAGFLAIVSSIMGYPGLFETILFIAAYVALLVTALNKTFSVIYVIPERILNWIGGQSVSYGEGDALAQVKSGVEGAAGAASGAAQKGFGSVTSTIATGKKGDMSATGEVPDAPSLNSSPADEAAAAAQARAERLGKQNKEIDSTGKGSK